MTAIDPVGHSHIAILNGDTFCTDSGISIHRQFPNDEKHGFFDPFVLFDDLRMSENGFPTHMHSGFEKLTLVVEGELHHTDDLGTSITALPGDAHFLRAGSGIAHSELPGALGCRAVQVWMDVPDYAKDCKPQVQWCVEADTPSRRFDVVRIRTLVGKSAKSTASADIQIDEISFESDGKWMFLPWRIQMLYVVEGAVSLGKDTVSAGRLIVSRNGDAPIVIHGFRGSKLLHLRGKPLGRKAEVSGGHVD